MFLFCSHGVKGLPVDRSAKFLEAAVPKIGGKLTVPRLLIHEACGERNTGLALVK
jgi:hypothetical protein